MLDPEGLIQRHRANGLLIDTNLFLLYLVGVTNEDRIAKFPGPHNLVRKIFACLLGLLGGSR
jgi:hypothetical protein